MPYSPPILQIYYFPLTTFLIVLNVAVFIYIKFRSVPETNFMIYPNLFIQEKHYWRSLTSSFSHIELIHLALNMTSLWSTRILEFTIGRVMLVFYIIIIVVLSSFMACHIKKSFGINYEIPSLGFSNVAFALSTILQNYQSAIYIFGISLPVSLMPFFYLIVTQVLIHRADFVSHLSGIILGYLISWNVFSWVSEKLFYNLIPWFIIFFVCNYKLTASGEMFKWLNVLNASSFT